MSKNQNETAGETAGEAEEGHPSDKKEAIYVQLGDFVKEKTGKRIGKTGGREIFDLVVAQIFAAAAADGQFRFNGGFGSLHTKTYQPGTRRLPSGQETTFGERSKLRYEEGVVTKALVANGGNLTEALKARGDRGASEAKAAEKPTKTAKNKTTAKPKPAPQLSASEGGDMNLD